MQRITVPQPKVPIIVEVKLPNYTAPAQESTIRDSILRNRPLLRSGGLVDLRGITGKDRPLFSPKGSMCAETAGRLPQQYAGAEEFKEEFRVQPEELWNRDCALQSQHWPCNQQILDYQPLLVPEMKLIFPGPAKSLENKVQLQPLQHLRHLPRRPQEVDHQEAQPSNQAGAALVLHLHPSDQVAPTPVTIIITALRYYAVD